MRVIEVDFSSGTVVNVEKPKTEVKKQVKKAVAKPTVTKIVDTSNALLNPISYKFYLDNGTDITEFIGEPSLEDSTDTLAASLSFKWVSDKYMLEVGDKIIVSEDGEKIFNGIVTTFSYGMNHEYSAKCYDYAFYLNKSEMAIQFNGIRADTAIRQLCSKAGVAVGSICAIKTVITKIFYGKTPSSILDEIFSMAYNELGKSYRYEMRSNKLYVEEMINLEIDLSDVLPYAEISCEKSIEEMRNSIVIIADDKEDYIYCSTADNNSIKKYGLLQHVERVSADNLAMARNTMNVLKNNLNRVQQTFSITLPLKKKCRSGRIFQLDYDPYKVSGKFAIKSCQKNLYGDYMMHLEVTLIEVKAGG